MNYELIEAEFNDIMHLFLNRKIGNTQSKEDFINKYSEKVSELIRIIAKRQDKPTKTVLKRKVRQSQKDLEKIKLM